MRMLLLKNFIMGRSRWSLPTSIWKKLPKHNLHSIQTAEKIEPKYSIGNEYSGFKCMRIEHISEFDIMSYTFQHKKVGTELWYLNRKDTNNVFSVNFRTTPFDSTGLPHILEHCVLCGSKKYPVRDPFFKMLNRSVATFMNAMTGPDFTLYPFSSINEVDYHNLQRIYLDAVFRPNLEYIDFLQEGWRLEHTDLMNKQSEYVIKGVVYNEMKGAFSENSSIFGQNLLNNLVPDHTYGNVSGGNPLEIPKLSHANLVDFHKKYYHPSNSKIFCYGNFNLDGTLEYINEEYLSKFEVIDNSYSRIPNQPRWDKSRNVHISSRFDNMGAPFERQNQIAIALLLSDITDINETTVLHVLSELLIRGPNSPFYKSLIEPNFSGGYNSSTGYDSQIKDTFFSIGLQDIRVEDFGRFQELFDSTIKTVIQEGFESSHIESVLHNIELSLKHQSPQFGMGLLMNSTPLWNHEGDVVKNLKVSEMIKNLRHQLKEDPKFFNKKVENYFANNSHRLTLTMSPDDHYETNFKEAELKLLKDKVISLTTDDRKKIFEDGKRLEESQKAPPNLDLLPCLTPSDVATPPKLYPLNVVKINKVPTQICNVHTNEISYLKCFFDASNLTTNEILLIPLFCNIISDLGTKNYDYRSFDKAVMSKTSGIDFKLHLSENIYDSNTYNLGILMTTHALDYNTIGMFDLCQELICDFKIDDNDRLNMLIENYISSISCGIATSGHLYAMQSSSGLVTDSAKLKSQLAGIEHIDFMKNLIKTDKTEKIMNDLKIIGKKLFNMKTMRTAINTSDKFLPNFMEKYKIFLEKLPQNDSTIKENSVKLLEPSCQHFVMNIPVNYCAKSIFTVPYIHKDHPTLRLLSKFLSAKYLLPVVREQNGAYGAGAKLSPDGIFSFYSYRDPNSLKTLNAFDETYQWLKDHESEITDQSLFEAKLGVLQQLDAPIAPGNMGIDFFLYGVSQEIFHKYRQRMLNVNVNELKKAIDIYFKDKPKHYGKCILGPKSEDIKLEKLPEKWSVIE